MTAAVHRLNHAVLYVRDVKESVAFYCDALGFSVSVQFDGAAFLRANGSLNDHDLGLFQVGQRPGPERGTPGLYHLAWQVDTIEELVELRAALLARGSLVGESDHGVSKSLYAQDPSGIEFEVMWAVPRAEWASTVTKVAPLDLAATQARWSGVSTLQEMSTP
jgi:catechol-2,3-dioxygenase